MLYSLERKKKLKDLSITELAYLYEERRKKAEELTEIVRLIGAIYDSKREFDKDWVWCHTCHKKHHSWSRLTMKRKHRTVKIPKQCLTKYDHIYGKELGVIGKHIISDYFEKYQFIKIYLEECIVCGHKKKVLGSIIENACENEFTEQEIKEWCDYQ